MKNLTPKDTYAKEQRFKDAMGILPPLHHKKSMSVSSKSQQSYKDLEFAGVSE